MKTLQTYLSEAIDRVKQGEADKVSEVLASIMPSVLTELHALVISDDSTQGQRKWALEALLATFSKVMTLKLRDQRADISKAKAVATREIAKVKQAKVSLEQKQASLATAREQRKIAKHLAAAEKARKAEAATQPEPEPPTDPAVEAMLQKLRAERGEQNGK